MKILMIGCLLVALTSRTCAPENEEGWQNDTYVAQDVAARKALADWKQFIKESDSAVMSAKIQISEANDRLDDAKVPHKLKFRYSIISADSNLEALSEKLLKAESYGGKDTVFDDETLQKMASFKADFKKQRDKLNTALLKLKNNEFK